MNGIDEVALNFSATTLFLLNLILGFVMFGVAIDLKLDDFRRIGERPMSFAVGLLCQFFILPLCTFLLVLALEPLPSIGLGMILVASCPGGNISNFFTYLAKGNAALSISMSAVSTAFAMVMTPLNFSLWGSQIPGGGEILNSISLSPVNMAVTIFLLMGLPLAAGLYISHRYPTFAKKAKKPMKWFSMAFFVVFVVAAFAANWTQFLNHIGLVFMTILLMNGLALTIGYTGAWLARLPESDRRAVSIEVGIQNSGLALILIFNFFGGLGGMAIVAAWWGVWHIITGYGLGVWWSRIEPRDVVTTAVHG